MFEDGFLSKLSRRKSEIIINQSDHQKHKITMTRSGAAKVPFTIHIASSKIIPEAFHDYRLFVSLVVSWLPRFEKRPQNSIATQVSYLERILHSIDFRTWSQFFRVFLFRFSNLNNFHRPELYVRSSINYV